MARTTNDALPARAGLIASLLLLAASVMFLASPGHAHAQSGAEARTGGVPMSKAWRKLAAKALGSCIIPAPGVTITPGSITFAGTTGAGTCNPTTRPFTVTNSGTAPLFINYLGLTSPIIDSVNNFTLSSNCDDSTFAPGQSCNGTISFCPSNGTTGTLTQSLVVYSDAPGSYSIPLTGSVTPTVPVLAPIFNRTPSSLGFSTRLVGTSSSAQSVTVSNSGTAPLIVSAPAITGPFSISSNTCSTVAIGGNCQIQVRYDASAAGSQFGTLTINHNAAGATATVSLSGFGVAPPGVFVTPSSLYLGNVEQGFFTVDYVTVSNYGAAAITPTLATIVGGASNNFSIDSDNCTSFAVNPGSSCDIGIRFDSVTAPSSFFDTLDIGVGVDIYSVSLSADTSPPYPNVTITPSFNDFGTVNVGSSSTCQTFEFKNLGPNPAIFDVVAPFAGVFPNAGCNPPPPACAATVTLLSGELCNVSYRFAPTGAGSTFDYLYANDASYWGYFTNAYLTGNGFQPGPVIQLDQGLLSFGSHVVGTPAPNQTLTVTNTGDLDLVISNLAGPGAPGLSIVTDNCAPYPRTLAPSATCTVVFGFTPSLVQFISDSATFFSNALNDPAIFVSLDGEGVTAPQASADFYPMSLAFGNIAVGASSAPQAVSFANTGSAPMTISAIANSGDYTVTHDCPLAPATLAAGTCCTIQATFGPTAGGLLTDTILVTTDVPAAGPFAIPLSGTGVPPPSLTASPSSVVFPDQIVSTTSAPFTVNFTNTGITDITITGSNSSGDFTLYDPALALAAPADQQKRQARNKAAAKAALATCGGPLLKTASCQVQVWFTPSTLGLRTSSAVITFSGGTGSPKAVPLAGNGISATSPGIALSADAVDFGGVVIGTTATRSVTVTSSGTSPLDVFGVRTPGAAGFAATTDCGLAVPAGRACSVTVECKPTALVKFEGDLYIDHSAPGGFRNVHLTCTGIPVPVPKIQVSATGVGFGSQSLGTASGFTEVQVSSVGTAPLQLGNLVATRPFTMTTDCPVALQPGLSCKVKVVFTPIVGGRQVGTLTIPSNDPGVANWVVNLNGTGCRPFSVQGARRGGGLCSF